MTKEKENPQLIEELAEYLCDTYTNDVYEYEPENYKEADRNKARKVLEIVEKHKEMKG